MRRRANRLPLELAVSFRELPFASSWQAGRTVNISKTGVLFQPAAPAKVPVGTPLEFVLLLSASGGAVDDSSETGVAHCTGRIVREESSNAIVTTIDEYQLTRLPSASSPFTQTAAFPQNECANADESTLDADIPDLDLATRLDVPVLITAVAGSDREEAARLIHRRGIRRLSPFVHVNCASSRPSDQPNGWRRVLSQASGGTLFLDEVGAMSVSLQRALLDVLCSETCDVRIIAGTGAPLQRQLEAGTFQQDLFYRINVIHLECRTQHVLAEDALVSC